MTDIRVEAHQDGERFGALARAAIRAAVRTANRYGDVVLASAKEKAPKFEHTLEHSGRRTDAVYDPTTASARTRVSFDAGHALYVEMGFRGHFVPFHMADSLYRQALIEWGWRIPSPDQLKGAKAGRRYLIPPGGKRPRWGVFVRGDAQPFLRPALEEFKASELPDKIAAEEFARAFSD